MIHDLNGEEITGSFYEKELQITSQKEFRIKKVLKRKGDKLYVRWKGYDNRFNSWIDKKRSHTCLKDTSCKQHMKMSQYFPKQFKNFGRNINVKVDLSNYATKN